MTYASTSIDRRAAYYARCADLIAADPLDYYSRAERGRKFLESRCFSQASRPPRNYVDQYLSDVSRRYAADGFPGTGQRLQSH